MLEVRDLRVSYGRIEAIHGISLEVRKGEIVCLIGANGAGKSTALRAVSGLLRPAAGEVVFDGARLNGMAPHRIVGLGLSHVPEGRMVFTNLTVDENLRMGAYLRRDSAGVAADRAFVLETFPRLAERIAQQAGTLSGGEQQMLAIGRALMGRPRCLMLDEPSLGIAPILVRQIFDKIQEINRELGLTVLLVEQNANLALEVSHRGYVLETGRVMLSGEAAVLRADERVREAYLGA
jgi:branched-chain amino acid transport system ATP-binding protein